MRGSDAEGDFVGFIPDLLVRLSELVGFQYEIKLVSDGKYGEKMTDGLWNGMIGELTRRVSVHFVDYFIARISYTVVLSVCPGVTSRYRSKTK